MARITLKGTPFATVGELPKVGASAPAFTLVTESLGALTSAELAASRPSTLGGGESLGVVGLVGDFTNQFGVPHFAGSIEYYDSAGQEVGERSVSNAQAVVRAEGRAEGRGGGDASDPFGTAKALQGER